MGKVSDCLSETAQKCKFDFVKRYCSLDAQCGQLMSNDATTCQADGGPSCRWDCQALPATTGAPVAAASFIPSASAGLAGLVPGMTPHVALGLASGFALSSTCAMHSRDCHSNPCHGHTTERQCT